MKCIGDAPCVLGSCWALSVALGDGCDAHGPALQQPRRVHFQNVLPKHDIDSKIGREISNSLAIFQLNVTFTMYNDANINWIRLEFWRQLVISSIAHLLVPSEHANWERGRCGCYKHMRALASVKAQEIALSILPCTQTFMKTILLQTSSEQMLHQFPLNCIHVPLHPLMCIESYE